jgi:exodeoxyribonuclease V
MVELTDHQNERMDKIINADTTVRTLAGAAGVGKTTLIAQLGIQAVRSGHWRDVVYLTSTGRAMVVLSSKLNAPVRTFHSAVYGRGHEEKVQAEDSDGHLMFYDNGEPRMIRTGKLFFGEAKPPCEEGSLVVVDEASMIPLDPLHEDLMRVLPRGCDILYVWDKNQLPPVGRGKGKRIAAPAAYPQTAVLTEIHRQAWDNPVIRISDAISKGETPDEDWDGDPRLHLGDYSLKTAAEWRAQAFAEARDSTLVAGTNRERQRVNQIVRKILGMKEIIEVGEILCCYKNDHQRGIMNGETFRVTKSTEFKTSFGWINVVTREGDSRPIIIQPGTIGALKDQWPRFRDELWEFFPKAHHNGLMVIDEIRENLLREGWSREAIHLPVGLRPWEANKWMRDSFLYVDYGYCLTIHKAQGSEWDEVGCLFGNWILNKMDAETSRQSQYTAVTRTKNRLLVWT